MSGPSVIARPRSFEHIGMRLSGQSRGKPFYLLWIPLFAGMTDEVVSRHTRYSFVSFNEFQPMKE